MGGWKQSYNGTAGVLNGQAVFMEYADPLDVPHLMKRWLGDFNASLGESRQPAEAVGAFVRAHLGFVRIHPFFDGNGSVAFSLRDLAAEMRNFDIKNAFCLPMSNVKLRP